MEAMSRQELLELPAVVDLRTAAKALGMGRTKAYELAQKEEFPCRLLRIGDVYKVPTSDLLAVLGLSREPIISEPTGHPHTDPLTE